MPNGIVDSGIADVKNHSRRDWPTPLAIALALLVLYGLTAPRTVALEDDGLFIMVAWFNGIAHPPGYPLYTLLAHPFSQIPIGSVAWRVHLLSGVFGALACSLLWLLGRQLGLGRFAATLTSLGYGVSQIFWSQAIIAEVYTLHILITFTLLNTLMAWRRKVLAGQNYRLMASLSALLFGLGLSNHWPMLVLTSPAFLLIVWPAIQKKPNDILRLLPWVALGLFPYIIMVINSLNDPVINFMGPIDSWQSLKDYILRRGYSEVDNNPTAGLQDKLFYLGYILRQVALQFGPVGFLLLALGIIDRVSTFIAKPNTLIPALLAGSLGTTIILLFFLNFDYDPLHQAVFRAYPITAYGFLALFMGFGVQRIIYWVEKRGKKQFIVNIFPVLVIILPIIIHLPYNFRTYYDWADTYGKALLELPSNSSSLFVESEYAVFTTGYLHYVETIRPDINLRHPKGLIFNTRIFPVGYFDNAIEQEILQNFIEKNGKPTYIEGSWRPKFASENLAFLKRTDHTKQNSNKLTLISDPTTNKMIDWVLHQPMPNDPWTLMLRHKLFAEIAYYLAQTEEFYTHNGNNQWYRRVMNFLETNYYANVVRAELVLDIEDETTASEAIRLLLIAEKQIYDAQTKKDAADLYLTMGKAHIMLGKTHKAEEYFKQAISVWPHPNAEAIKRLASLN